MSHLVCPKCKRESNTITIKPNDESIFRCHACGYTAPLKDVILEPQLQIKYRPGGFVDTITIKDDDSFNVGELKEALDYFDDDTPIYVSQGRRYGSLFRMISHEPDGTITFSCKE